VVTRLTLARSADRNSDRRYRNSVTNPFMVTGKLLPSTVFL